jgi:hypothetical protein
MSNADALVLGVDGCSVVVRSPLFRPTRTLACGALLAMLAAFAAQADAAICKYQGPDGRITYTNLTSGPPGASRVECFTTPAPVSPIRVPAPSGATVVTAETEERNALERQLADEEQQLEDAQRALSEREASLGPDDQLYYDGALGPLYDAVTAHQRQRDRIRHALADRGWDREPPRAPRAGIPLTESPGAIGSRPDRIPDARSVGNGGGSLARHPAAGLGQQRGGWTGSREAGELGRR